MGSNAVLSAGCWADVYILENVIDYLISSAQHCSSDILYSCPTVILVQTLQLHTGISCLWQDAHWMWRVCKWSLTLRCDPDFACRPCKSVFLSLHSQNKFTFTSGSPKLYPKYLIIHAICICCSQQTWTGLDDITHKASCVPLEGKICVIFLPGERHCSVTTTTDNICHWWTLFSLILNNRICFSVDCNTLCNLIKDKFCPRL